MSEKEPKEIKKNLPLAGQGRLIWMASFLRSLLPQVLFKRRIFRSFVYLSFQWFSFTCLSSHWFDRVGCKTKQKGRDSLVKSFKKIQPWKYSEIPRWFLSRTSFWILSGVIGSQPCQSNLILVFLQWYTVSWISIKYLGFVVESDWEFFSSTPRTHNLLLFNCRLIQ